MKDVRVLQLQTGSGASGGIANYISELVHTRSMQDFELFVVVGQGDVSASRLRTLYDTARVVKAPASYTLRSFLSYVRMLREIIQSRGICVVHAHALRSAFAASVVSVTVGTPFVYTNHGLRFCQEKSPFMRVAYWVVEWFVCRTASCTCAIREYDHKILARTGIVSEDRLHYINVRLSGPSSSPTTPNASNREDDLPLLVGIGSLVNVKRPDRFLRWLSVLAKSDCPFRAVWVGNGPLLQSLQETAKEWKVPVEFLGELSRSEVVRILSKSYVLLLTSQFEVMPLAVLEAYSQGVPVISGRFPGVNDVIVANKTGIVVDPDDPHEAAQSIERLLRDRALRDSLGQCAATLFADRFANSELMAESYAALYRGIGAQSRLQ